MTWHRMSIQIPSLSPIGIRFLESVGVLLIMWLTGNAGPTVDLLAYITQIHAYKYHDSALFRILSLSVRPLAFRKSSLGN